MKESRQVTPPGGTPSLPASGTGAGPVPSSWSKPVSAALDVPFGQDSGLRLNVLAALAAIDVVHDDGDLPLVQVVPGNGSGGLMGAYRSRWSQAEGRYLPVEMELFPADPQPLMTVAHEVGHFLDEQILGAAGGELNGSEDFGPSGALDYGEMGAWRVAVFTSGYHARLRELLKAADLGTPMTFERSDGSQFQHELIGEHLKEELLPFKELWARSYAQYIAKRSKDPRMLRELEQARDASDDMVICYPLQWDEDDFEPIDHEIDALLQKRGWKEAQP